MVVVSTVVAVSVAASTAVVSSMFAECTEAQKRYQVLTGVVSADVIGVILIEWAAAVVYSSSSSGNSNGTSSTSSNRDSSSPVVVAVAAPAIAPVVTASN